MFIARVTYKGSHNFNFVILYQADYNKQRVLVLFIIFFIQDMLFCLLLPQVFFRN